ncbi:winged helix-turn-helix domain-containing protein [Nonomuraea sp. SMC257]|uniref:Winged helix-turn-helix domain-containing protein n=1 Tax=Nonomuraea montanisoli TaxID=2741721 RepID=A0A7Y6M8Z9_9ACTN|nr:BTAD domain-containing putative transcriptional regulator [Nonomuraea montanisoli]NUW38255.1 winged helix-turn-helix domain-containing protein [Nonomuraea montanisoli]
MEFRVLGPLEARDDTGGAAALGGPRPRTVLARLLAAPGALVSTDALLHAMYGDTPPPSALPSLHSYVSHLRRALEPGRRPRSRPALLVSRPPGYLLATEQVDAVRFTELVDQAGRQPPRAALACLEEALSLWRGQPYAEFDDQPWAVAEVRRLTESRLVAVERRARALLALRRPDAVVATLEAETTANPLRERLWCLLALSLYRTGRQAEALGVLRRAGRLLADQLGLDPGPELRALERDILHHADSLGAHLGTPAPALTPTPTPASAEPRRPAPEPSTAPPLRECALRRPAALRRARGAASEVSVRARTLCRWRQP